MKTLSFKLCRALSSSSHAKASSSNLSISASSAAISRNIVYLSNSGAVDYPLSQLTSSLILHWSAQLVLYFSSFYCLILFSLRRESNCRFNENSSRRFLGFEVDLTNAAFWHSSSCLARILIYSYCSSNVSVDVKLSPLSNYTILLRGSSIYHLILKIVIQIQTLVLTR